MEFLKFKLEKLSEKYKLNFRNFRFENKKIFFKQKTTIYYGVNNYLLKISSIKNHKIKSNFFFPFFISKNEDDLENWLESISVTYKNKVKLLSTIDEGKDKRNKFKRKYKI